MLLSINGNDTLRECSPAVPGSVLQIRGTEAQGSPRPAQGVWLIATWEG